jgi:alpha-L-fucosidase
LTGGNLKATSNNGGMEISVPSKAPDAIASVIKIEVKGEVANVNLVAKDKMKTGELD